MYQKIGINSNDDSGKNYLCQFRSERQFLKFQETYQNYPGYCIMTFDIWDESKKSFGLPTVSANYAGFSKVINALKNENKLISSRYHDF